MYFVGELTWLNVAPEDLNIIVPVSALVLVVESKSVEDLMLHYVVVHTPVFVQGDILLSTLTANARRAAEKNTHTQSEISIKQRNVLQLSVKAKNWPNRWRWYFPLRIQAKCEAEKMNHSQDKHSTYRQMDICIVELVGR